MFFFFSFCFVVCYFFEVPAHVATQAALLSACSNRLVSIIPRHKTSKGARAIIILPWEPTCVLWFWVRPVVISARPPEPKTT